VSSFTGRLTGFGPEDRLLFECSRLEIDELGAERILELVAQPLKWDVVLEASVKHGVAPLLKRAVDQVDAVSAGMPADVAALLDELYDNSCRRNARLFGELSKIVSAMRARGADPVGLKDVELAVEVYPERGLRPMGDVDLLVRREDWPAAVGALSDLGFVARPGRDVPYMRKYATTQHFRRAQDDLWIDLQWNVLEREWDLYGIGRFTYDGPGMWERAVPMRLDGYELRVPNLEDMLFHLCLHLEGHMYSELVLFCDIAELLRRRADEFNWDGFLEITRGFRAESSVYYVLLFCEKLLGAPVPPEILSKLEPAYFHGGLLTPLLSTLTRLHLSLDEIRLSVAPPKPLMDELERIVRRQAARALTIQNTIDEIGSGFLGAGGSVFCVEGPASQRVFPDPSLPAFEPLHIFILDRDEPLMRRWLPAATTVRVQSKDPVLAGTEPRLALIGEWSAGLANALARADQQSSTNARSAARSLRDRLVSTGERDDDCEVPIVVHTLTADEMVTAFAARVATADENRMFELCSLLEVIRHLHGDYEEATIAAIAARHGVEDAVSAGLLMAGELIDRAPRPPLASERIPRPVMLEWARYGPSSLRRYPWLRRAYYFLFALLATRGTRSRLAYLWGSMRRRDGHPAVLPSVIREVALGAARSRSTTTVSMQSLAHWLEPTTAQSLQRHLTTIRSAYSPPSAPAGDSHPAGAATGR
jgi:Uncharacterised nucleotidyltransferase